MVNKRVLTGIVLAPILYVIVWVLPSAYFAGLAVIAAAIGQYELYAMVKARAVRPMTLIGTTLGALVVLSFYFPHAAENAEFLVAACILLLLGGRLFSPRPVEGALEDVSGTFFGIFYVALLFGFQVAIHRGVDGKYWLVLMYLVIWASDTGAYYIGTAFGRHRLYEKISPKKSIEGLAGGVAASMATAYACRLWLLPSLGPAEAVLLGGALALVGTMGDLAESLVKRSAGVKDSGSIIPGHGGVLDRMDSMLFAAPVLYYYIRMR